ncbi:MAG: hypothetical protein ACFFDB_00570 [Promethearchaeota archaeon]
MERKVVNLKAITEEIFKLIFCSMDGLSNLYDFVYGLPDNLSSYLDDPKRYRRVRGTIETIYNYFLEETISSYESDLSITKLEAVRIRKLLAFKKPGVLALIRDSWEDVGKVKGDRIKNLIRNMTEEQRILLQKLLSEHKERVKEDRLRETTKRRRGRGSGTPEAREDKTMIKVLETSEDAEVKAAVLDKKLKNAREELLKSDVIVDSVELEDKKSLPSSENRLEENKQIILEEIPKASISDIDKKEIKIICPICQKDCRIQVPNDVILQKKSLASISIRPEVCCEHSFIVFLDKLGKIRGYQNNDLEIEKSTMEAEIKDSIPVVSILRGNITERVSLSESEKDIQLENKLIEENVIADDSNIEESIIEDDSIDKLEENESKLIVDPAQKLPNAPNLKKINIKNFMLKKKMPK